MLILGLDISKTSGGFSVYDNCTVETLQHTIDVEKNDSERFIKCFNSLKDFIYSNLSQRYYDVVIVEDVFMGSNVDTFRVLSVLNLCIDYCVKEGIISCGEYLKVSNKLWKSWLFSGDSYKGMSDKERIRLNVLNRGYNFDSLSGSQDRYDATGMILGYLNKDKQIPNSAKQKSNISLKDLNVLYCLFKEELEHKLSQMGFSELDFYTFNVTRVNEKSLLKIVEDANGLVAVSERKVNLGNLGEYFNAIPLIGGGYLAVWCE